MERRILQQLPEKHLKYSLGGRVSCTACMHEDVDSIPSTENKEKETEINQKVEIS
jgi:hypothetical protein